MSKTKQTSFTWPLTSGLLVSPDRALFHAPDEAALQDLKIAAHFDSRLATNLRQLLGWSQVGKGRDRRWQADNWQLLEDVKWLTFELPVSSLTPSPNQPIIYLRYLPTPMAHSSCDGRASMGQPARVMSGRRGIDAPT